MFSKLEFVRRRKLSCYGNHHCNILFSFEGKALNRKSKHNQYCWQKRTKKKCMTEAISVVKLPPSYN